MAKRRPAKKKPARRKTVQMPVDDESWKKEFSDSTIRSSFILSLSQAMIEFLSAVADGVHWDRSRYFLGIHKPDNFIATGEALKRRGLIRRKSKFEIDKERDALHRRIQRGDSDWDEVYEKSCYVLTPAGEALVELLKVTDVFVEADSATIKKYRKRG